MKEVMKQESKEVAELSKEMQDWGQDNVSSSDIVIPKLKLMQGLSNAVSEGHAVMGDFVNSLTNEKLPNPVRFVPVLLKKVWYVKKRVGKDFEFVRIDSVTAENENQQWEQVIDGEEYSFTKSYNFYGLVDDYPLPFIIAFSGMNTKIAKQLTTQVSVLNKLAKLPFGGMVIELSCKKEKNDKGVYYIFQVKPVERTSPEKLAEAFNWYQTLSSSTSNIRDDDSDLAEAPITNAEF